MIAKRRLSPIARKLLRLQMQKGATKSVAHAWEIAPEPISPFERTRLQIMARRTHTCADTTVLKLVHAPNDATRIEIKRPRACRNSLCTLCARFIAQKRQVKLQGWINVILDHSPAQRFAFVTLTSRNLPIANVQLMLRNHEQALARFWRAPSIKRAFKGQITGIEIAIRKDNDQKYMAGVHSHSVVALADDYFTHGAGRYLRQRILCETWQKALRVDYQPVCHITAIPNHGAVLESLRECVKYSVAPATCFEERNGYRYADPEVAKHIALALYKRRMVRYGGIFAESQKRSSRMKKGGRA